MEAVKVYCNKVRSLADSPKKVAAGVALGLAFDFLPIPVVSIPLSYLAARVARCNPVATVATAVFFKLAVPFFYTLNVLVGTAFFGDIPVPDAATAGESLLGLFINKIIEHGYPFLAGSLINATLAWLAVYFPLVYLLERGRRRWGA